VLGLLIRVFFFEHVRIFANIRRKSDIFVIFLRIRPAKGQLHSMFLDFEAINLQVFNLHTFVTAFRAMATFSA
jgi:hypothetical protein